METVFTPRYKLRGPLFIRYCLLRQLTGPEEGGLFAAKRNF